MTISGVKGTVNPYGRQDVAERAFNVAGAGPVRPAPITQEAATLPQPPPRHGDEPAILHVGLRIAG